MAFDFPTSPPIGQTYTQNGVTYTWDGKVWFRGGTPGLPGSPDNYVKKAGDTMLGFLTANADPVDPLHYATKRFVETLIVPPTPIPPVGLDGQALVALGGNMLWGAPIHGGNF